jgi:hypothetical protein
MVLISPRPLYTLSFRLPRQTLWDIPQPLLPLPRCSLFACHLSAARSALLLRGTTERNRSSRVRRIEGTRSCFRAWLRGDVLPLQFPFPSDFWFQLSFELWDLQRLSFRISSPPSRKLLPMEVRLIDLRKAVSVLIVVWCAPCRRLRTVLWTPQVCGRPLVAADGQPPRRLSPAPYPQYSLPEALFSRAAKR